MRYFILILASLYFAGCSKVEIKREYYTQSGALHLETSYKNDKKHGIERGYYENGNLKWELKYKKDKKRTKKVYYENGDLMCKISYRNGEPHKGKCGNGKKLTKAHLLQAKDDLVALDRACNN